MIILEEYVALYHTKNKNTPMVIVISDHVLTKISEYTGMNDPVIQNNSMVCILRKCKKIAIYGML